jgi:hypothetical protein
LQLDVLSEGDAETAATPTASTKKSSTNSFNQKIFYSISINSNSHQHQQQQHGQEYLTPR